MARQRQSTSSWNWAQSNGVNRFGGATEIRQMQPGFPARLTSTFDSTDGYSWEQLALDYDGSEVTDVSAPLTGNRAFTPDNNESLTADTDGWMEPSPDGQGYLFIAGGGSPTYVESYTPSATTLTPDNTYVDLGFSVTVPAGKHLITASWTAYGQISATPMGYIVGHVYNDTTAATLILDGTAPGMGMVYLLDCSVVNLVFYRTTTVRGIKTFSAPTTIRLRAARFAGPTWTTAEIAGSPNALACTRLSYEPIA